MMSSTICRLFLLIGGLTLAAAPVGAQLALPGAAASQQDGAAAVAPKSKRSGSAAKADKSGNADKSGKAARAALKSAPGAESIDGRPLMLNGKAGLLQISGRGETLQIDKLSLAGEGVSDPTQRCILNIVGEKPIVAVSDGRPDGLERYHAEVPACPFAFDVLDGAVLVPAQITACVFKSADCQTSPSGLWGPDGTTLAADAAAIGKRRTEAENAMASALHGLEDRAKNNADAAALVRDQSGFAGERDDICRDYVQESEHGFCAASVTAARAALLEARLAAFSGSGGKSVKSDKSAKADKSAEGGQASQAQEAQTAGGRRGRQAAVAGASDRGSGPADERNAEF